MTLTTSQLRREFDPPGETKGSMFIPAYRALDDVLRRWQFDGGQGDTGAYNKRKITGGSGWSLHAYGPGDRFTFWWGSVVTTALAVDIDWQNNPYGPQLVTNMPRAMVDEILAIRTNTGAQVWRWGGDYGGNKDAMHFEIVCTRADLASGIRTPTPQQEADAMTPEQRDEVVGRLDRALGLLESIHPAVAQIQTGVMDPVAGVRTMVVQLLGQAQTAADPIQVAQAIAGALPDDLARQVADELARRLAA